MTKAKTESGILEKLSQVLENETIPVGGPDQEDPLPEPDGKLRDVERCVMVMWLLYDLNKPDIKTIHQLTGISRSAFFRILDTLRTYYRIETEFIEERNGKRGRAGYYRVTSWGIINPKLMIEHRRIYLRLFERRQMELQKKQQKMTGK